MAESWELLVKWQGRAHGEASWESLNQFKEEHPKFQLEDELFHLEGGSVVGSFFGQKYSRRKKIESGAALVADCGPLADKCRLAELVQSSVSWFN
jgi:hypothetical protein